MIHFEMKLLIVFWFELPGYQYLIINVYHMGRLNQLIKVIFWTTTLILYDFFSLYRFHLFFPQLQVQFRSCGPFAAQNKSRLDFFSATTWKEHTLSFAVVIPTILVCLSFIISFLSPWTKSEFFEPSPFKMCIQISPKHIKNRKQ